MANKVKPKQLSRPRRDVILNFPVEEEGRLLLEYVTSKMPQATRTTLKSYLRHNQIAIDGVPCNQFDHELAAGSLVQVNTTREFQVLNNRHPISGDMRYGASPSPAHRLCLHAATLRFVHPVTRRDMNFKTPIPSGFMKMVN